MKARYLLDNDHIRIPPGTILKEGDRVNFYGSLEGVDEFLGLIIVQVSNPLVELYATQVDLFPFRSMRECIIAQPKNRTFLQHQAKFKNAVVNLNFITSRCRALSTPQELLFAMKSSSFV